MPLKFHWLYKSFLKDKRSIYEIRRFMNEYICFCEEFGGWWIFNLRRINYAERIKCKDILYLIGSHTFLESLRAVKDNLFCTSAIPKFKEDL